MERIITGTPNLTVIYEVLYIYYLFELAVFYKMKLVASPNEKVGREGKSIYLSEKFVSTDPIQSQLELQLCYSFWIILKR